MNTNGLLSFGTAVSVFSSDPFPVMGPGLVAPFWADVDTRGTGEVYYRETNDTLLLSNVTLEIRRDFENFTDFTPTTLFIATWDEVGYFDNNTDLVSSKLNEFLILKKVISFFSLLIVVI